MILLADSEGPDQTARKRSLILGFTVPICAQTRFRMVRPSCYRQNFRKWAIYSRTLAALIEYLHPIDGRWFLLGHKVGWWPYDVGRKSRLSSFRNNKYVFAPWDNCLEICLKVKCQSPAVTIPNIQNKYAKCTRRLNSHLAVTFLLSYLQVYVYCESRY